MMMTMPMNPSMTSEMPLLSVSQLNAAADDLLRSGLGLVWVEGEVSNLRQYANGHRYFTLKDAQASISCTLFRGQVRHAESFRDGDHVEVQARAGVYLARGQFQLVVERLRLAGLGALLLEFQRLKERLQSEGLFAAERKKAIPVWVQRIGVITSPQGDVQHDILRTLVRRFPLLLPFRLYPVPVQGAGAVPHIVDALRVAGQEAAVDVLILARGGGSLEDLRAFNDEQVARAIAACPIPVVTGIGHETDTTIADLVADLRASTPTAAAEAVSPDARVLRQQLRQWQQRLLTLLATRLRNHTQQVVALENRLQRLHPGRRLQQHQQRIDELTERLSRALHQHLAQRQLHLRHLQRWLAHHSPQMRIVRMQERLRHLQHRLQQCQPTTRMPAEQRYLQELSRRLQRSMHWQWQTQHLRLQQAALRLQALNPESVLNRGYSILLSEEGHVLRNAHMTQAGHRLRALLAQGELSVQVLATRPWPKSPHDLPHDPDLDSGTLPPL